MVGESPMVITDRIGGGMRNYSSNSVEEKKPGAERNCFREGKTLVWPRVKETRLKCAFGFVAFCASAIREWEKQNYSLRIILYLS